MRKAAFLVLVLCVTVFSACGRIAEVDQGIESDYDVGYRDGYDAGYGEGYDEGFQYATNFILDRMDEEYRETWWQENIKDIMEVGLEF